MVPFELKALVQRAIDLAEDRVRALVTPRIPLPASVAEKRVVVVGASVGKAWRLHLVFPNVRSIADYRFDKSETVAQAIHERPDAIVLKECAAYFPERGGAADLELLRRWIREIRGAGILAAVATVVPVNAAHAARVPGRAEAIRAFNESLRAAAAEDDVPVLDLEAALRTSAEDRLLGDGLDSGDGLHLSTSTYRDRLDSLVPPLLLRLFSDPRDPR
jgi:hypothetical protein